MHFFSSPLNPAELDFLSLAPAFAFLLCPEQGASRSSHPPHPEWVRTYHENSKVAQMIAVAQHL